jgi:hypothetical protein
VIPWPADGSVLLEDISKVYFKDAHLTWFVPVVPESDFLSNSTNLACMQTLASSLARKTCIFISFMLSSIFVQYTSFSSIVLLGLASAHNAAADILTQRSLGYEVNAKVQNHQYGLA